MRLDVLTLAEASEDFEFHLIREHVLMKVEVELFFAFCVAGVARSLTLDALGSAIENPDLAKRVVDSEQFQAVFVEIDHGVYVLPDRYKIPLLASVHPATLIKAHERWFLHYLPGREGPAGIDTVYHGIFAAPDKALDLSLELIDLWERRGRIVLIEHLAATLEGVKVDNLSDTGRVTVSYANAKSLYAQRAFSEAAVQFNELIVNLSKESTLKSRLELALSEAMAAAGFHDSALESYSKVIERLESNSQLRIRALLGAGEVALKASSPSAKTLFHEALRIADEMGIDAAAAQAIIGLASCETQDRHERIALLERAFKIFESMGDIPRIARVHLIWAKAIAETWPSNPDPSVLLQLTGAVVHCSQLGWGSGIEDAVTILGNLIDRAEFNRPHLVQLLVESPEPLMVSVGIRCISDKFEDIRRTLAAPTRCFEAVRTLLEIYCNERLSNERIWFVVYEFQTVLASIRSDESELVVLFRTIKRICRYDLSRRGLAWILESLCFEALRLGNANGAIEYLSELQYCDTGDGAVVEALLASDFDRALSDAAGELTSADTDELFTQARRWRAYGFVLAQRQEYQLAIPAYMKAALGFLECQENALEIQVWRLYEEAARSVGDARRVDEARRYLDKLSRAFKLPLEEPMLTPV
ncbi:MAG TPA: hypothetical protein VMA34_05675 [Terracidiphilus sp.]|nr:hypothetical protein [Terracidiphilus sp.]